MAREFRFEWRIVDAETEQQVSRGGTYVTAEAVNVYGECESVDMEVAGALRAFRKIAPDLEREAIIDGLTAEQESKLKDAHAESIDTFVLDDDMPDAYEAWLMELSLDELKRILKI